MRTTSPGTTSGSRPRATSTNLRPARRPITHITMMTRATRVLGRQRPTPLCRSAPIAVRHPRPVRSRPTAQSPSMRMCRRKRAGLRGRLLLDRGQGGGTTPMTGTTVTGMVRWFTTTTHASAHLIPTGQTKVTFTPSTTFRRRMSRSKPSAGRRRLPVLVVAAPFGDVAMPSLSPSWLRLELRVVAPVPDNDARPAGLESRPEPLVSGTATVEDR